MSFVPQSFFLYHTPYCLHHVLDTFLSSLVSFFNKDLKTFTSSFDNYFRSICCSISLFYISDTINISVLDVYNSHHHQNCILQGLTSGLWTNYVIIFFLNELYLNNTFDCDKSVSVKKSLLFCYKTVWLRSTLVGVLFPHCCHNDELSSSLSWLDIVYNSVFW